MILKAISSFFLFKSSSQVRIKKYHFVTIFFRNQFMTFVIHKNNFIMDEKENLKNESETNGTINHSNDLTEENENLKTQEPPLPSTPPVDPPPTTSPEGAGEVIKPIEGRERNPKKG